MSTIDKELEILEHIHTHPHSVRQRDLARIVGLSLGMTNAILKRLAQKGLLTIRKVNNRNIMYAVSPQGIEAITRKSYRYLKRTIKNVVYYRQAIEKLVCEAVRKGFDGIVLVGPSDLDFIVEHACARYGAAYVGENESFTGRMFFLYSERSIPDDENTAQKPGARSTAEGSETAAFIGTPVRGAVGVSNAVLRGGGAAERHTMQPDREHALQERNYDFLQRLLMEAPIGL